MVIIYDEQQDKTFKIQFKGKVKGLLEKTGHNPTTILVTRGDELLTEEEVLKNTDKIELRSVISGG
jgi:sulfur carrier protein ThiS